MKRKREDYELSDEEDEGEEDDEIVDNSKGNSQRAMDGVKRRKIDDIVTVNNSDSQHPQITLTPLQEKREKVKEIIQKCRIKNKVKRTHSEEVIIGSGDAFNKEQCDNILRHASGVCKGKKRVNCVFSYFKSNKTSSVSKFKRVDGSSKIGKFENKLGEPIKTHPEKSDCGVCCSCYRENLRRQERKSEYSVHDSKNRAERTRLKNIGFQVFDVPSTRHGNRWKFFSEQRSRAFVQNLQEKNFSSEFSSIVMVFEDYMDTAFMEIAKNCKFCEISGKTSRWKLVDKKDLSNKLVTKEFICEEGIHKIVWGEMNEWIKKKMFADSYVQGGIMQSKFVDLLKRNNIKIPGGSFENWKSKIHLIIEEEWKFIVNIAREELKERYPNGTSVKCDVQWETKRLKGKRATKAHKTIMAGEENLIIDHECADISDITEESEEGGRKSKVYNKAIPKVKCPTKMKLKHIIEKVKLYEELSGKKLVFDNFDKVWESVVDSMDEETQKKKKKAVDSREKKKEERIKNLKKKFAFPDDISQDYLNDKKRKSEEFEYWLRIKGKKITGNKKQRLERLLAILEDENEERVEGLTDESSEEMEGKHYVRDLEKFLNWVMYHRFHQIGITPRVWACDGCKQGQGAVNCWIIDRIFKDCILALDPYHGKNKFERSIQWLREKNSKFEHVRLTQIFQKIENMSRDNTQRIDEGLTRLEFEKQVKTFKFQLIDVLGKFIVNEVGDVSEEEKGNLTIFLLHIAEYADQLFFYERTSEVESFHSTVNIVHQKGVKISFDEYKAKMKMCVIKWNVDRMKLLGILNREYDWRNKIRENFMKSFK